MLRVARQQQIQKIIGQNGNIAVSELHKMLGVSEVTIRRDLMELEDSGMINRVHGGAVLADNFNEEPVYSERKIANQAQKAALARHAVSLIEYGQSIFLDAGTTCNEVALLLPDNMNLTVVTNNLDVLSELKNRKGIILISLGGELGSDGNTLDGTFAIENAELTSVDLCFFSTKSFSDNGLYNTSMIGSMVKRTVIQNARYNYFIADSGKHNNSGMIMICKWSDVDVFLTDSDLEQEAEVMLKKNNVNYIKV